MTAGHRASALAVDRFPRSSNYDPAWVIENLMGPNVLWLAEFLSEVMELRPGMRVLDMGCGKAVSSIFLAKELGVQVWATDLWIDASDNRKRVEEAGVADRVFPIHAEAHGLPLAHDFFDAAVSLDAYHYFGTDDLYLGYFSRFLKSEAQLGIVVPGLRSEIGANVPAHMSPHWTWDFCSFHSPDWWRVHWEKTGLVEVSISDWLEDGWKLWLKWLDVCKQAAAPDDPEVREILRKDQGRYLGFTRVVARRLSQPLYRY